MPTKSPKKTAVKVAKKSVKKAAKKTTKKAAKDEEPIFDVSTHVLVPKHELVSDSERKELLEHYAAKPEDFPKILVTDPAIRHLSAKESDIIRITRDSATAGSAKFYRIVVVE
ncbi:DNA-directed RNA polymerase subunit H [Candidatus Woesearchaeota archaeon]|nr:DNA-directed RNA polymerase subunit H [Candidatus Woesearchaeota archaeon]